MVGEILAALAGFEVIPLTRIDREDDEDYGWIKKEQSTGDH